MDRCTAMYTAPPITTPDAERYRARRPSADGARIESIGVRPYIDGTEPPRPLRATAAAFVEAAR